MSRSYLLILLFLWSTLKCQEIDSAWMVSNYSKQEVMIGMRDGVKLFTVIYSPRSGSEKNPLLLMRTPYSCAPYGKEVFSPRLYKTHWKNYLKEGYIIVMQDVRGSYMSEGEFVDVRPYISIKKKKTDIDESSDAFDTIDWLVKNVSGNNGKVGTFGISYPGFYSTMTALSRHPALKAASPQAPVTDWFIGDDFHHNGAFALMDAFRFYSGFGRPRPLPTKEHKKGYEISGRDNYDFFLKKGPVRNFTALLGDSIRFWSELVKHPDYDDWWKARDARRHAKDLKCAVMVVGGLFDAEDCWGAWNLYKAIETQDPKASNRLVMGPWYHGGWHRDEGSYLGNVRFGDKTSEHFQKLELAFFDHHLRNKGDGTDLKEAEVFFTGENSWRTFGSWPPAGIKERNMFIRENASLSFTGPPGEGAFSSYISYPDKPVPYTEDVHLNRTREYMTDDQRFAARRPDVLVFKTPVLENDLTLAGPVIADLMVQLSTTDADLVVKLIDVFPDNFRYEKEYCCDSPSPDAEMAGYQMLVRGEIFRGRYRKSFEKPEAFIPGKTENVKFVLPDVAHTFKKGHQLMVQIQSSWFPLFDRNPQQFVNIYECGENDFIPCEIKVLHQPGAASKLILPVMTE